MMFKNNISQENRIIFALRICKYKTIRRNITLEGISSCFIAIASTLFSNYYTRFYVYYLQQLFLENNNITYNTQRKNNFYTFHLKSFEHNNVMLFQKINKRGEGAGEVGGSGGYNKSGGIKKIFEKEQTGRRLFGTIEWCSTSVYLRFLQSKGYDTSIIAKQLLKRPNIYQICWLLKNKSILLPLAMII